MLLRVCSLSYMSKDINLTTLFVRVKEYGTENLKLRNRIEALESENKYVCLVIKLCSCNCVCVLYS